MTVKEDLLYYVWKFGKLHLQNLQTSQKEAIQIINLGTHNFHAGPDFFNAQLRIGNQVWAGNVEMHVNASDWFVHHHEKDKNYDNVILHVVWNHDMEIHRKDNSVIPTFIIKDYINFTQIQRYTTLMNSPKKWINCENEFPVLNDFQLQNWLERVYLERLEKKAIAIETLVKETNYDWEAVLFRLLAKGFGLKLNSEAFFEAACAVDFSVIRKLSAKQFSLEAFLFGIFGLLSPAISQENYHEKLKQEFNYLSHKFEYDKKSAIPLQFFRTRPANFPTIRASQLATLYHKQQHLFSKVITSTSIEQLYSMMQVATASFWETHYTFEKISPLVIPCSPGLLYGVVLVMLVGHEFYGFKLLSDFVGHDLPQVEDFECLGYLLSGEFGVFSTQGVLTLKRRDHILCLHSLSVWGVEPLRDFEDSY